MKTFASLALSVLCLTTSAFTSDAPKAAKPDAAAGEAKYTSMCAACHGADGNSASGDFPNLAGQRWRYIYIQLKDYKEGRLTNPIMSAMAAPLSRQDIFPMRSFKNHRASISFCGIMPRKSEWLPSSK